MSNEMQVAASERRPVIHTEDEQGYVVRSLTGLIFHAANRHASVAGGKFYFGGNRG